MENARNCEVWLLLRKRKSTKTSKGLMIGFE
jgi:hypothetical protein